MVEKYEYLANEKDFIHLCVPCGDCWAHAPDSPLRKDALPSPYLKCPAYERHGLILSYAFRGICGMADAVYHWGFTMTRDVAERVYACYTCGMCAQLCWMRQDTKAIIRNFRTEIIEAGLAPLDVQDTLRSIRDRKHPWRGTRFSRTDWANGLNVRSLAEDSTVDIVYWVGCTGALEDRSMKIAQAMGKLLVLAGVRFGILGDEESCCGEPALSMGDSYLFQEQAEKNINILKKYNTSRIITTCPHCYNVLKNDYPKFGSDFEVLHHTEYLADLIRLGKIKIQKDLMSRVTYHDPCFLGRENSVYDPPRQILTNIVGANLVEMTQNRRWSYCCGGGGGHMWLEDKGIGNRPNVVRAGHAIEKNAETIVTSCPFCLQQLEDGIRTKELSEPPQVVDIAELLASVV